MTVFFHKITLNLTLCITCITVATFIHTTNVFAEKFKFFGILIFLLGEEIVDY